MEQAVGALADRQRGVVSRRQLLELGLGPQAIKHRLRAGRLHRIHRGVYAIGHPTLAPGAREFAAALACGPDAVVSHRSAAQLYRLLPHPAQPGPVHISVRSSHRARVDGIEAHRVRDFGPGEAGTLDGIPITSPGRTVLDLAATDPGQLERVLAEAHARRLRVRPELLALLERYPGRRGTRALRTALEQAGGPRLTRSKAERRFLALIRGARLPAPEVNVRVGRYEVDFLWRGQRLVVEIDGYWFHSSPVAFERDRAKEAEIRHHGLRLRRFSWRQVETDPEATIADVAMELAATR